MPTRSKKQTVSRFVELNLKVPKEKFPLVEEAFTAILDLAGLKKVSSEKPGQAKTAPASKPGRKAKAKPVKAKPGRMKQPKPPKPAKTKASPGRRPAVGKNPPSPKIAALIRDLRTEAGLSQKALAEKLGASQNAVSLLETGRQKPNLDMAIKLGQILRTPFKGLLE